MQLLAATSRFVWVALAVAAAPVGAVAQRVDSPRTALTPAECARLLSEGRSAWTQGKKLEETAPTAARERFETALESLQQASNCGEDPLVTAQIGLIEIDLHRGKQAFVHIRQALRSDQGRIAPRDRQKVEEQFARVRHYYTEIPVEIDVDGASIFVNSILEGESPLTDPIVVERGELTLRVEAPGYPPQTRNLTIDATDPKPQTFKLLAEQPAQPTAPPAAPELPPARGAPGKAPPPPVPTRTRELRWLWVLGAGGAVSVAGFASWWRADRLTQALRSDCTDAGGCSDATLDHTEITVQRLDRAAHTLLISGAALSGAGASGYVWRRRERLHFGAALGPRQLGISSRLDF